MADFPESLAFVDRGVDGTHGLARELEIDFRACGVALCDSAHIAADYRGALPRPPSGGSRPDLWTRAAALINFRRLRCRWDRRFGRWLRGRAGRHDCISSR